MVMAQRVGRRLTSLNLDCQLSLKLQHSKSMKQMIKGLSKSTVMDLKMPQRLLTLLRKLRIISHPNSSEHSTWSSSRNRLSAVTMNCACSVCAARWLAITCLTSVCVGICILLRTVGYSRPKSVVLKQSYTYRKNMFFDLQELVKETYPKVGKIRKNQYRSHKPASA